MPIFVCISTERFFHSFCVRLTVSAKIENLIEYSGTKSFVISGSQLTVSLNSSSINSEYLYIKRRNISLVVGFKSMFLKRLKKSFFFASSLSKRLKEIRAFFPSDHLQKKVLVRSSKSTCNPSWNLLAFFHFFEKFSSKKLLDLSYDEGPPKASRRSKVDFSQDSNPKYGT